MNRESPSPDREALTRDEIVALEEPEAAGHGDWMRAAPPLFARRHGLVSQRDASAHLFAAGGFDVLAMNVVILTGSGPPPGRDEVASWKETFRRAGSRRFFVQVSPATRADGLDAQLGEAGLRPYNRWARLWRSLDELPAAPAEPRVERIRRDRSGDFGRLVADAFSMPEATREWLAAAVGRPGWHHYLAFEADEPVAAAVLFVHGTVGWFSFAATREDRRGRGAQSALIAHRLHEARRLGCTRVTVETAEDKPEKPAPSFHNLRRLGFRFPYYRPNYLFEFPAAGA